MTMVVDIYDRQTIAKKLSKNISKETNKLRVHLEKYNAASLQKYPMLMLTEILSPLKRELTLLKSDMSNVVSCWTESRENHAKNSLKNLPMKQIKTY